jgi:hypothetical protein
MEAKIYEFWKSISTKLEQLYGDKLIQVSVYRRYLPSGRLAIILKDDSVSMLLKAEKITNEIRKKKLPAPLFFNQQYIESSLDTFPLEFLDIQSDYDNLYNKEDIFKNLKFKKSDVRHQMERELKGKWLHIKMALLDYNNKPKILQEILAIAVQSVLPVVKGLIFLEEKEIPKEPAMQFKLADDLTEFSINSFNEAFNISMSKTKINKEQFVELFDKFAKQLSEYMHYIDGIEHD